ncbi:MAG: hypothetical protein ACXV3D_00325 [Halobacteriota archaeon]
MTRVRCINPKCTAPEGIFTLDKEEYLEPDGQFVKPGTPGAVDIVVQCTECGAENKVSATKVKRDVHGAREI